MTGIKSLENGADRLYDERVTLRSSIAFNFIKSWAWKIFSGIGAWIDEHTGWIAPYIGAEPGEKGYKTGYAPAPAIASDYRTAPAREDAPRIIRIEDYRPVDESWEGVVYGKVG